MYGLFRFDPRVTQITLPHGADVARPWGFPCNVYVLHGATPALIGTGPASARPALLAALERLHLAPSRVARVLLPSCRPGDVGNLAVFPRAAVFARADDSEYRQGLETLRQRIRRVASQLVERGVQPAWTTDTIDRFEAAYFAGLPEHLDAIAVRDGQRLRLSTIDLEIIEAPGVHPGTCAFFEPERRWLFGGPTVCMAEEVVPDDAASYMETLRRLSTYEPAAILPSYGGIERHYQAVFRSTSLAANNLLTNMPFALPGPLPLPEIGRRDLGAYPSDLIRFTGTVLRYEAMLAELVRTGVAQRDGEDLWSAYRMDRPSRM